MITSSSLFQLTEKKACCFQNLLLLSYQSLMRELVWRSMKDQLVLLLFIVHDWLSCEWMVNVRPDKTAWYPRVPCDNIPFLCVSCFCSYRVSVSVLTGAWGAKTEDSQIMTTERSSKALKVTHSHSCLFLHADEVLPSYFARYFVTPLVVFFFFPSFYVLPPFHFFFRWSRNVARTCPSCPTASSCPSPCESWTSTCAACPARRSKSWSSAVAP